jgi:hypothetical protein
MKYSGVCDKISWVQALIYFNKLSMNCLNLFELYELIILFSFMGNSLER